MFQLYTYIYLFNIFYHPKCDGWDIQLPNTISSHCWVSISGGLVLIFRTLEPLLLLGCKAGVILLTFITIFFQFTWKYSPNTSQISSCYPMFSKKTHILWRNPMVFPNQSASCQPSFFHHFSIIFPSFFHHFSIVIIVPSKNNEATTFFHCWGPTPRRWIDPREIRCRCTERARHVIGAGRSAGRNRWILDAYVKHMSNICQTYVKHMSNICQTYVKHMSNICQTWYF